MKIIFDIRPIRIKGNGIYSYTKNLREHLKLEELYSYNEIDGVVDNNSKVIDKIKYHFWNQIVLPYKLYRKKANVYHATKESAMPLIKVCKYITTIHDIIPYIYKKEYFKNNFRWLLFYRVPLWIAIRTSDIIITDSEFSKKDIIKHLKVDENKIKVVYLTIEQHFREIDTEKKKFLYSKFGLSENQHYILGIGAKEFRKNSDTLIKAFQLYKIENEDDIKLIIVGEDWKSKSSSTGDEYKEIVFTGYVSDEELVMLYNYAEVFVYPSIYEGFGLPPLEAMACGTPVITSKTTSIPEIVGNAAILVDPTNYFEIKEAISCVLHNKNLSSRLIKQGKIRVEKFKVENMINNINKIYDELLQSESPELE
ncbi:glycosyltransferase family 4 protein [Clostridium sp. DL1XJH146]